MNLWNRPMRLKTNKIAYLIPGGHLIDRFLGNEEIENGASQMWIASVVQSALEGASDSRSYLVEEDGGACLAKLLQENPAAYLGEKFAAKYGATPGFLLKLLNSRDRLLAQVHPDGEKAMKYFKSPFGKTESWYVLDTEPGEDAYIWAGFQSGVTRERWKELIVKQDTEGIMNCLHRFVIHPGDVIFIPAGLPHAMGKGSLVAELQEPTDITLRAERFRPDGSELPEESMHSGIGYDGLLDCFAFDCAEETVVRERIFLKPQVETVYGGRVSELIGRSDTRCFSMRKITCDETVHGCERENDRFAVALVLSGRGWVEFPDDIADGDRKTGPVHRIPIKKGSELFLPHGLKTYRYVPEQGAECLEVLECMPPEL